VVEICCGKTCVAGNEPTTLILKYHDHASDSGTLKTLLMINLHLISSNLWSSSEIRTRIAKPDDF